MMRQLVINNHQSNIESQVQSNTEIAHLVFTLGVERTENALRMIAAHPKVVEILRFEGETNMYGITTAIDTTPFKTVVISNRSHRILYNSDLIHSSINHVELIDRGTNALMQDMTLFMSDAIPIVSSVNGDESLYIWYSVSVIAEDELIGVVSGVIDVIDIFYDVANRNMAIIDRTGRVVSSSEHSVFELNYNFFASNRSIPSGYFRYISEQGTELYVQLIQQDSWAVLGFIIQRRSVDSFLANFFLILSLIAVILSSILVKAVVAVSIESKYKKLLQSYEKYKKLSQSYKKLLQSYEKCKKLSQSPGEKGNIGNENPDYYDGEQYTETESQSGECDLTSLTGNSEHKATSNVTVCPAPQPQKQKTLLDFVLEDQNANSSTNSIISSARINEFNLINLSYKYVDGKSGELIFEEATNSTPLVGYHSNGKLEVYPVSKRVRSLDFGNKKFAMLYKCDPIEVNYSNVVLITFKKPAIMKKLPHGDYLYKLVTQGELDAVLE